MTTRLLSLLLILTLAIPGCAHSTGPRLSAVPGPPESHPMRASAGSTAQAGEVWRRYAESLPIGSLVRIVLTDGARVKGTLMVVEPDAMVVKPKTRLPEPARRVPFSSIESMEPERGGIGAGKAVLIGVASGAASFMTMFVIALTLIDD